MTDEIAANRALAAWRPAFEDLPPGWFVRSIDVALDRDLYGERLTARVRLEHPGAYCQRVEVLLSPMTPPEARQHLAALLVATVAFGWGIDTYVDMTGRVGW